MTPGCMSPTVSHVSGPWTPPRPITPPPYSPVSPVYCPDPTPSLTNANIVNIANTSTGGNSPGNCSGGSVIIDPGHPRPGNTVFK